MTKKHLLVCVACVAVLIAACKRTELSENPMPTPIIKKSLVIGDSITQVTCSSYSFLKFDNREVFINTLSLLDNLSQTNDTPLYEFGQNFSFTSLWDNIELLPDSLKRIKYETISNLLAAVVSEDSIVQIDSVAFLFSFEDSSIYEMYPVTCANLSILKLKQEVNNDSMYVFKYNFHDPVFHPSGYEPFTGKAFRWLKKIFGGCDDIWAHQDGDNRVIDYTLQGSVDTWTYLFSHYYHKYGVYFEIVHTWKHMKNNIGYAVPVSISNQDNWKVFCGGGGSNAYWPNSTYRTLSEYRFRTYQSSNSLARNHNTVKSYLWFQLPGIPNPSMYSPFAISLNDLHF